jgi:hypothetical protein
MIKYKAEFSWEPRIKKVEVERETAHSVFFKGTNERKQTQYHAYFDSFQEAKDYVCGIFEDKVERARRSLEVAKSKYGNAKGLKEIN